MRIGIVNDMALATEALRRVVESKPEYRVAWTAKDGAEAVQRCAKDRPDLILMDLLMPVMNGVEATARIMSQNPVPILVVTATVSGNYSLVYEAMGRGALDAVNTPVLGPHGDIAGGAELLKKIGQVSKFTTSSSRIEAVAPIVAAKSSSSAGPEFPLVAIGASTGGPQALGEVLSSIPAGTQASFVVVQHITQEFAKGLATWLSERSPLPVIVAETGMLLEPGRVFLAGTNDHLVLRRPRLLEYTPHPVDNPMRPSVDVFFASAGEAWPRPGIAVLLTGMGRDGAAGMLQLKQRGWHTIAQDEASCVVAGMPAAAIRIGAAKTILPLGRIGPAIVSQLKILAQAKP